MLTISYQNLLLVPTWLLFGIYATTWAIRGPQGQFDLFWPVRLLAALAAALAVTVIALVVL